jgi:hypothetical protein
VPAHSDPARTRPYIDEYFSKVITTAWGKQTDTSVQHVRCKTDYRTTWHIQQRIISTEHKWLQRWWIQWWWIQFERPAHSYTPSIWLSTLRSMVTRDAYRMLSTVCGASLQWRVANNIVCSVSGVTSTMWEKVANVTLHPECSNESMDRHGDEHSGLSRMRLSVISTMYNKEGQRTVTRHR